MTKCSYCDKDSIMVYFGELESDALPVLSACLTHYDDLVKNIVNEEHREYFKGRKKIFEK